MTINHWCWYTSVPAIGKYLPTDADEERGLSGGPVTLYASGQSGFDASNRDPCEAEHPTM